MSHWKRITVVQQTSDERQPWRHHFWCWRLFSSESPEYGANHRRHLNQHPSHHCQRDLGIVLHILNLTQVSVFSVFFSWSKPPNIDCQLWIFSGQCKYMEHESLCFHPGNAVGSTREGNANSCAKRCARNWRCVAWSFRARQKTINDFLSNNCYLRSKSDCSVPNQKWVWGTKNCFNVCIALFFG